MEVRGQLHASAAVLLMKEPPRILIQQDFGWSERFGDNLSGIKSRTVTRHYTDYAIPSARIGR
jgi:hypothetical protein